MICRFQLVFITQKHHEKNPPHLTGSRNRVSDSEKSDANKFSGPMAPPFFSAKEIIYRRGSLMISVSRCLQANR